MKKKAEKGKIFILSGPSGSGKTTLYKKLLSDPALRKRMEKTVSFTTRPKRPGERHGRDYFFISRAKFFSKKKAAHFVETEKVFEYYYGTPKKQVRDILRKGKNVLLCIDVKGAGTVSRLFPEAIKIFVKAPSLSVLKKRLMARKSDELKTIQLRLRTAQRELAQAKFYDYVIVNKDINEAYKKLRTTIKTLI